MIKAVIFDMVGPLLAKRPGYISDGAVEVMENLKNKFDDDGEYVAALAKEPSLKGYTLDQLIAKNVAKYAKIDRIWNEFLPRLKKKGYKLGVINNGTAITIPLFKQLNHFDQYFAVFLNSSEEGMAKPASGLYVLACEKLNVAPQECVFIDDSTKNVAGANALGMTGIQYTDYENLISKLASLGVI